jgi:N utilization substance protein B
MKTRTRARSIALQALYEIDIAGHDPGWVWEERIVEESLDDKLSELPARSYSVFSLLSYPG